MRVCADAMVDKIWNDECQRGQSITNYKSKWRNIWIRDVFCYRISAPNLCPGVPTKPCLKASIKKFNPHFFIDSILFFRPTCFPRHERYLRARRDLARQSQIMTSRGLVFSTCADNHDLRCILRQLNLTEGAGCKARLESRIKPFSPLFICD